jgi:hypothetical protein
VVLIDMKIADRLDPEIHKRVPGQLLKHVIKKADPGRNLINPGTIKVELNVD